MPLSRRHFLVCGTFAAQVLGQDKASALSLESAPALLSEQYASRCQGDTAAQQAFSDLASSQPLSHERAALDRLAAGLKSLERCPLCGCPVQMVAGRMKHLPPS